MESQDETRINQARDWLSKVLDNYHRHLSDSEGNPFAGIPELTNAEGAYCLFSCESQAWSCSGLIELVYELNYFESIEKVHD